MDYYQQKDGGYVNSGGLFFPDLDSVTLGACDTVHLFDSEHFVKMPKAGENNISEEAQTLVDGNRQNDYGNPVENWTNIAKVWSGILGFEVTAEKASLCMVGLKVVREAFKHKKDNLVDAVGYLEITKRISDEKITNSLLENVDIKEDGSAE